MTQLSDSNLDRSTRRRLWYADGMSLLRRAAMPRTRPSHTLCEVAWFIRRHWEEPRRSIALAALRGEDILARLGPGSRHVGGEMAFILQLGATYGKIRLMRANIPVSPGD